MERPGTLLLVEDEHLLRTLVAQVLRMAGYQVEEAADGREGIARYDAGGPFDLVLLDLNLPYRSGVEVARHMRRRAVGPPILVVSAAIMPHHEADLRAIGVVDFLTKPYHPGVLLERVGGLVGGRRCGAISA